MPAPALIPVPEEVSRTAAAALLRRQELQGGGSARSVVIATALSTGYVTPHEVSELRRWHARNPDAVRDGGTTLLGGLYGGPPARLLEWEGAPKLAAALNPEGTGAMIALPVPDAIAVEIARDDGEPVGAMHLTLFHLGSDASELDPARRAQLGQLLASVAARSPAPAVDLSHVERFTAGEEGMEPAVLVDDGPAVYTLRQALQDALDTAGQGYSDNHAFRAHVTIGYYDPGDGPESGPVAESLGAQGFTWTPDAIELHWGAEVDRFPFATAKTAALRSPLRDRLAKLSTVLNDTDRKLRLRLHAASEVALGEALRQANQKLNVRARTKAQKAMVAAASALTPAVMAAVGVTEQELLDKRFDTLAASATAWIMAGERRKLRAIATALGLDPSELEVEYGDELDRRAAEAAGFLAGALGLLARATLSGSQPPTHGELSGPVPFGLVRDTWLIGATGATAPRVSEVGPGPSEIDGLAERLATTGQTIAEELLQREGVSVQVRSTWTTGGPDRPFEPHAVLEGTTWVDTQPEELAWDASEFPYVDVLEPGDHDGCVCEIQVEYEPYDGEGAPADLSDAGELVGV